MDLSLLQENLNKGLSIVSRLVNSKNQLPVLNNILLMTDHGRLRLSATNLEAGINFWVGAKIEKEGAITIPAKILSEFVASLSPGRVQLSLSENNLKVVCGPVEAVFNGISASEFPAIPVLVGEPTLSFEPHTFIEAVSKVAFAAATDEGRQVLTGVKWIIRGGEFTMVATDGYRLSVKKFNAGKKKEETELLVPARALLEMVRILGETKQKKEKELEKDALRIRVTPGENQVIFEANDAGLVTRLLEGQFPNFEKIIPSASASKTVLDAQEFLGAVRVAAIFARDSANLIKLLIEKDHITISANAPQMGENKTVIEAKTEGDPSEIAFNCRYLLDLLNNTSVSQLSLETSGPLKPGVFRFIGDDSFLHIIMPVRVQ